MKKFLALLLVVIAVGQVNTNVVETESPLGTSVIMHGSTVKLFYRGEHSGKVMVKIANEKGKVVFTETMQNTEHFMRPYNFSSLPEGEYTIELTDETGKRFHTINHTKSVKRNAREAKSLAHVVRLKGSGNKYLLTVPNEGRCSMTVRIFDAAQKLVYEGTQTVEGDFAKLYSLTQRGEYTFQVASGEKITSVASARK